jgi:hypothetical protein
VAKGTGLTKFYTVGGPGSDLVVTTQQRTCLTSFTVTTSLMCSYTYSINLVVGVSWRGFAS